MNSIHFAGKEYTLQICHPICRAYPYFYNVFITEYIENYNNMREFVNENSHIKIIIENDLTYYFVAKNYDLLYEHSYRNGLEGFELLILKEIHYIASIFGMKNILKEFEKVLMFI